MIGSSEKVIGLAAIVLIATGCSAHVNEPARAAAPTSTATATATATEPATFTLPTTLDGLSLSKNSSTADLASATKDDLVATSPGLTGDAVVGSYVGTGKDAAVLIGLPIAVDDIDAQASAIFDGLRSMDLYAIDEPKRFGDGGMQCADASVIGGAALKLGICVTGDGRGSIILLRFTKDATATATVLSGIAPDFER